MIKLKQILLEQEIKYSETMRDYHSGQSYMTAYAKLDGKTVGWCDYSIYQGKIYIDMLEVDKAYQRKGIATGLMNFIKQENKDKKIIPGMSTDAGDKFWKSYSGKLSEKFYDIVQSIGKDKKDWVDLEKNPVKKKIETDFPIRKNIFDLVDYAYRTHLGEPHVGVKDPDDVVGKEYDYWEAIDINDNPDADAVIFGKKKYGVKISGLGHNGEQMSKEAIIKHMSEMLKKPGYWIEASGAVAVSLKRFGVPVLTDKEKIEKLFPSSKITQWFDDGSYTRTISNVLRDSTAREYLFGNPKI